MKKLIPIIILLICCNNLKYAMTSDWLCWRGPHGNGLSTETGWNPEALKNGANILWKLNVGKGHSAVVVQGNRVYTMGNRKNFDSYNNIFMDVIYCLDAQSGKEIWHYSYSSKPGGYAGPGATPCIGGNFLYTVSRWGNIYCINATTGKVKWQQKIMSDSVHYKNTLEYFGSPMIFGDLLIINAGHSGMAYHKYTGRRIWGKQSKRYGYATPVLYHQLDNELVLIGADTTLYALDIPTGKRAWSFLWEAIPDAVVLNNKILLSGARSKRGSTLIEITNDKPSVIWQNKSMYAVLQTCVVIGGYAYGFSIRKYRYQPLQCVDIENGMKKWEIDLGEWGAISGADNKLIILTGTGDLVIARASPEKYQEISRANVIKMPPGPSTASGCFCWTAPVLANARIYARSSCGKLVCVDVR